MSSGGKQKLTARYFPSWFYFQVPKPPPQPEGVSAGFPGRRRELGVPLRGKGSCGENEMSVHLVFCPLFPGSSLKK